MKHFNTLYFLIIFLTIANIVSAQDLKLSMKEAVALAIQNNPELKIGQKEIEKSLQQKVIARSLFLPTVYANASISHYFKLTPFFGFGDNPSTTKIPYGRYGGPDQFGTSVSMFQPLYNPAAAPTLQRSKLLEQDSRIGMNAREVAILSAVKEIYLQLLVLNERIVLQQESILRNRRVLKDASSLLVQGKGLRVDTLRAYTEVKNLEPALIKLTFAEETGKLQLKALLGINDTASLTLSDSLIVPEISQVPAEEDVYNTALQNNPNLKQLDVQQKAMEQQVRLANASRLPVVALAGQYQVQSQTQHLDYTNGYFPSSSFVALQVAVPLFTGFSNQAKVQHATINQEQSLLNIQNVHTQLRARVHQVIADERESWIRMQTTASVKQTAKLSYSIIQYRYAKGISSRLELNDAELALSTSQQNFLESVYDNLIAQIKISELMGKAE